jgi:hypothetical protein
MLHPEQRAHISAYWRDLRKFRREGSYGLFRLTVRQFFSQRDAAVTWVRKREGIDEVAA